MEKQEKKRILEKDLDEEEKVFDYFLLSYFQSFFFEE